MKENDVKRAKRAAEVLFKDDRGMADRLKNQMDSYEAEYDADKEVKRLKKALHEQARSHEEVSYQSFMVQFACDLCEKTVLCSEMDPKLERDMCRSCLESADEKDFPLGECPLCSSDSLSIKNTLESDDAEMPIGGYLAKLYVECSSCGGSSPSIGRYREYSHSEIVYSWKKIGSPFLKEGYIDFKAVKEDLKADRELHKKIKLEKKGS